MQYVIVLVVLAGALFIISAPLRAQRRRRDEDTAPDVADLEAARDAKYREIRDAELDVRTGKLSDEDYTALDQTLRGEAIAILNELDHAQAARAEVPTAADDGGPAVRAGEPEPPREGGEAEPGEAAPDGSRAAGEATIEP